MIKSLRINIAGRELRNPRKDQQYLSWLAGRRLETRSLKFRYSEFIISLGRERKVKRIQRIPEAKHLVKS